MTTDTLPPANSTRPAEDPYRQIFENLPIGIYRSTPAGQILDANPALLRMLGYEDRAALQAATAADFYADPEERKTAMALLEQQGEVLSHEIQLRRRGGELIWAEDNVRAVRDADGKVLYFEGNLMDITARKLAEEALARRAREMAALYEISLEINAQRDHTALLHAIVERAAALVGASVGGLYLLRPDKQSLELVFSHNLPGAFVGTVLQLGEGLSGRVLAAGEPLMVSNYSEREGQAAAYRATDFRRVLGVPLKLRGEVIGVINVTDERCIGPFDESEIRLVSLFAEQAANAIANARLLEDAQRRAAELDALREASLSVTSSLELHTVLETILESAMQLIGGLQNAHIFLYSAGELRFGAALWTDGARDQPLAEPRPEGLTYTVARSGEMVVVSDIHDHPLFVGAPANWYGAIVGLPLTVADRVVGVMNVSSAQPRKWADAELRMLRLLAAQAAIAVENAQLHEVILRHAAELELRVAERTTELTQREAALRAANERLQALDQLKNQFVANVSHELRTPLANIKTHLYLLERGRPDKQAPYLATIRRETDLLGNLIENLLQLSRLDQGKSQPDLRGTDVNALALTLASDRMALFAAYGLTLESDVTPGLPPALADPQLVTQVMTNLLTNAMHYTHRGGVVRLCTGVGAAHHRNWVTIAVNDTGMGIPEEERMHLFERFFRGDAARRSNVPGTGLGLAICAQLVEQLHGQITVESVVGKGSTFTVWLPQA